VQAYLSGIISCQLIEAAVAIAQIEIVGIGLVRGSLVAMLDSIEAFRLRQMEWVQDQRVQDAKDHGVCADAQCQSHDGHSCEAGRPAQHAERESHIPQRIPAELQSSPSSTISFDRLHAATLA